MDGHVDEVIHEEVGLGAEDFAVVGVREVIVERDLNDGHNLLARLLILVPVNDHYVLFLLREFLVEVLGG